MDLSVYNTSLDLCGVVDEISSLIWHRRFFKSGYFKLIAPATKNNAALLVKHNIIEKPDSVEIGYISSVVMTNDDSGEFITVTGNFLSGLLANRIILTPHDDFLSLIDCNIAASASSLRSIPNLYVNKNININSGFYAELYRSNLAVYSEAICMAYNFGLRVKFIHDNQKHLLLEAYYGTDRSILQKVNPQIVFSYEYDNLLSAKYQYSENNSYSTVYAKAVFDSAVECSGDVPSYIAGDDICGFERLEKALNIPAVTYTFDRQICTGFNGSSPVFTTVKVTAVNKTATLSVLQNEGDNNIAAPNETFTGKVFINEGYKSEYNLGDIVTVWHEKWNIALTVRITEITEVYENGSVSTLPVFGSPLPVISDLLKK